MKFFESSRELQELRLSIESKANATKAQKILELRQKNEEYRQLKERAERQSHDHPWVEKRRGRGGYYDKRNCEKCHLIKEV